MNWTLHTRLEVVNILVKKVGIVMISIYKSCKVILLQNNKRFTIPNTQSTRKVSTPQS